MFRQIKNNLIALLIFLPCCSLFSQGKTGVLVMAHGGSPVWEASVINAVAPLKQQHIIEIAFGMADPMTLQPAINKLEAQGVTTIIVVPLFISSHSPILRQTEYLFGFRKQLADEPLIMNHGTSSDNSMSRGSHSHGSSVPTYLGEENTIATLDPLVFHSKIIITKPLDADTLVAKTLYDNIQQFSKTPEKETVILVAHGPNSDEDNKGWLKNLDSLAKQIQARQIREKGVGFKNILFATVRDDANRKIYNEAKKQLRAMVENSNKEGVTIIVPVVLATGGIEKGIQKRLKGLNYVWVNRALLPHENITKFIEKSITNVKP